MIEAKQETYVKLFKAYVLFLVFAQFVFNFRADPLILQPNDTFGNCNIILIHQQCFIVLSRTQINVI